jgi:hypothetical protein
MPSHDHIARFYDRQASIADAYAGQSRLRSRPDLSRRAKLDAARFRAAADEARAC